MTATRWKLVASAVLVVVVVLIAVFAVQKNKCDDWRKMVRRDLAIAVAPPPGFLRALEDRRPIGCKSIIHGSF